MENEYGYSYVLAIFPIFEVISIVHLQKEDDLKH